MISPPKAATSATRQAAGEDHGTNTGPGAPGNGVTLDVRPLHLPAIAEHRTAVARRRATAFLALPDRVLCIDCQPLSPASYSLLHAVGSPFLFGGTAGEREIKQYLWFHSPLWCDDSHPGMRARYHRALRSFNRLLIGRRGWRLRRPCVDECAGVLALAANDIFSHVADAFADAPAGSGRPGQPLAALEAQLIHEFARAYRWEPERTRHTPLRQLFQLHRCIRAERGEDIEDEDEERIKAAHYARRNAELASARVSPTPSAGGAQQGGENSGQTPAGQQAGTGKPAIQEAPV